MIPSIKKIKAIVGELSDLEIAGHAFNENYANARRASQLAKLDELVKQGHGDLVKQAKDELRLERLNIINYRNNT